MTLLYHLKPRNLMGTALYPLNQLRGKHPEVYEVQVRKYEGREQLLERKVPMLDCLWNDVLFFSPVHPNAIKNGFENVGKSWRPQLWLEIDPVMHDFNAQNTVIYHSRVKAEKGDFSLLPDQFSPFKPSEFDPIHELPSSVQAYYQEAADNGDPIFPWHGLPHILHYGSVDLAGVEVIEL